MKKKKTSRANTKDKVFVFQYTSSFCDSDYFSNITRIIFCQISIDTPNTGAKMKIATKEAPNYSKAEYGVKLKPNTWRASQRWFFYPHTNLENKKGSCAEVLSSDYFLPMYSTSAQLPLHTYYTIFKAKVFRFIN